MRKIKADMVWKDADAIFIKNGNPVRDVTVDMLAKYRIYDPAKQFTYSKRASIGRADHP